MQLRDDNRGIASVVAWENLPPATPCISRLSSRSSTRALVVWDSVYDGRTDDTNLFALQSTIAAAVSDSLRVVMLARERRALDGAHSEGFGLRIMNPPL